jgi:hypothetical protein
MNNLIHDSFPDSRGRIAEAERLEAPGNWETKPHFPNDRPGTDPVAVFTFAYAGSD